MAHIKCDKCDGKGFVDEDKLSLADLVEPFVTDKMVGFRVKAESLMNLGRTRNRTPSITGQEQFPEVVDRLDQIE